MTLGQHEAPSIGYASLGLSLEQYGVNEVQMNVPGAVAPTAAEKAAYACGDLTPTEVQAGQTTITCGVTNPNDVASASSTTSPGHATTSTSSAKTSGGSTAASGGGAGVGGAAAAGGADPGVSLTGGSTPLAYTGGDPVPVVSAGGVLFLGGAFFRRRYVRARSVP